MPMSKLAISSICTVRFSSLIWPTHCRRLFYRCKHVGMPDRYRSHRIKSMAGQVSCQKLGEAVTPVTALRNGIKNLSGKLRTLITVLNINYKQIIIINHERMKRCDPFFTQPRARWPWCELDQCSVNNAASTGAFQSLSASGSER